MHTRAIRWAGLSALIFGAALLFEFSMGYAVHVWDDSTARTLEQIAAKKPLYVFHTLVGLLLPLFLAPLTAGLFLMLGSDGRRSMTTATVFVAAAVALMVASGVLELELARIASGYAAAGAGSREAILRHGEEVDRLSVALGTGGFIALAVPTVIVGRLMLRTGIFAPWLGRLAVGSAVIAAPGLLGFFAERFFTFHLVAYLAQIGWLLATGRTMWRIGSPHAAATTSALDSGRRHGAA